MADLGMDGGGARVRGFDELARLLGHLGELEKSNQLFQEGLSLLDQQLPNLPLPTRI